MVNNDNDDKPLDFGITCGWDSIWMSAPRCFWPRIGSLSKRKWCFVESDVLTHTKLDMILVQFSGLIAFDFLGDEDSYEPSSSLSSSAGLQLGYGN